MLSKSISVAQLGKMIDAKVLGNGQTLLHKIGTVESASEGDICFFANPALRKYLPLTLASAVIIGQQYLDWVPSSSTTLLVEEPTLAYIQVANYFHPKIVTSGIHQSAMIDSTTSISEDVSIAANVVIESGGVIERNVVIHSGCVIGQNVSIAEGCEIHANVTIYANTKIAKNVLIKAGAVIGADGFGFTQYQGRWIRIPQVGHVIIEEDVEIGANTTVDRGAINATVLSKGVKIDNQVQIAHNVTIGEHTGIAGCTGIAGSVKIGAHCMISGGVGITGHLHIVDHVFVSAMSFVTNSIKQPGSYSGAVPLQESKSWRKSGIRFKQLDDLARRIKKLERKSE